MTAAPLMAPCGDCMTSEDGTCERHTRPSRVIDLGVPRRRFDDDDCEPEPDLEALRGRAAPSETWCYVCHAETDGSSLCPPCAESERHEDWYDEELAQRREARL